MQIGIIGLIALLVGFVLMFSSYVRLSQAYEQENICKMLRYGFEYLFWAIVIFG